MSSLGYFGGAFARTIVTLTFAISLFAVGYGELGLGFGLVTSSLGVALSRALIAAMQSLANELERSEENGEMVVSHWFCARSDGEQDAA